jgi:hypothetical protein
MPHVVATVGGGTLARHSLTVVHLDRWARKPKARTADEATRNASIQQGDYERAGDAGKLSGLELLGDIVHQPIAVHLHEPALHPLSSIVDPAVSIPVLESLAPALEAALSWAVEWDVGGRELQRRARVRQATTVDVVEDADLIVRADIYPFPVDCGEPSPDGNRAVGIVPL